MGANLCQSKCGVLRIILCFLANQLLSHICSYQSPAIAQGMHPPPPYPCLIRIARPLDGRLRWLSMHSMVAVISQPVLGCACCARACPAMPEMHADSSR